MSTPRTLREVLEGFSSESEVADEEPLLIKVSREDVHALGLFFIRGMSSWVLSLTRPNSGVDLMPDLESDVDDQEETTEALNEAAPKKALIN